MHHLRISLLAALLTPAALSQSLSIYRDTATYGLRFIPESGFSYKVDSTSDMKSWTHLVSLRGDAQIHWPLPPAETGHQQRFFRTSKVTASGLENLKSWSQFQNAETGRYHVGLIGDSYTHNRERYAKRLKQTLTTEYGNLGAGYLGFGFGGFPPTVYPNGSIDDTELSYTIPYEQWSSTYGNGYRPDACHITSAITNASLTIQVLKTLDSFKLYYATKPTTAGFRYRISGGPWSTVVTDAPESLGIAELDGMAHTAPYPIEIETLGAGVNLIGVEAIKLGNGVVVHKLGATGRASYNFTNTPLSKSALQALNLDMAIIMFGTNEQLGSQEASLVWFKGALSNIISTLRLGNPQIDVVLLLPCYTKYEVEDPKRYKLQQYGHVMRELAIEKKAAFLDFTEVFGPASELQNLIDAGLMHTDRIHPTTGVGSGGWLMSNTVIHSVFGIP